MHFTTWGLISKFVHKFGFVWLFGSFVIRRIQFDLKGEPTYFCKTGCNNGATCQIVSSYHQSMNVLILSMMVGVAKNEMEVRQYKFPLFSIFDALSHYSSL